MSFRKMIEFLGRLSYDQKIELLGLAVNTVILAVTLLGVVLAFVG
jgi:hypothetical protein